MKATAVATMVVACLVTGGCVAAGDGATRASESEGPSPTTRPATGSASPLPPGGTPTETPTEDLAGTNDWRLDLPAVEAGIEAFTTRVSGPQGARVGLKVSTSAKTWQVVAYRIGDYRGGSGHVVWKSGRQGGEVQPEPVFAPSATRTIVAPWRLSLVIETDGWPEGYYVFKLRTGSGAETQLPYIVSSRSAEGSVALVAPVTTWQAYNDWGGYSLYDGPAGARSWAVSFDRPYHAKTGANDFRTAALPIVLRAERLGIPLSYFANVDLHAQPHLLDGARGYVSMGHDEYWTTTMRTAVMEARDDGTNLAFLGANTMYWRIRLSPGPSGADRTVTGYRSDAHLDPLRELRPQKTTARFRDQPAAHPENDLIGMKYECYPVDADYVVVSPGWWGFRGTGVELGDRIEGLVGPEADRVYPDRFTPRPLQILSHTTYDCRGVDTSSQSVYYTTRSGAGVMAAGTLRWGCALVAACDDPLGDGAGEFVGTVTDNLLREYAAGPVGSRHPARDNVSEFDLPEISTVSAS